MKNKGLYQSPETEPRFFYGYFVVVAAFFTLVLMFGIFNSFGVFFKPLSAEFGWTRAVTSGALSLNWIVQGFMAIVMGKANDRFGPRLVMTFCGFSFGLGYLLISQMSALWQLYLFYAVLVGTGVSGTFVPLASMVARWFVKRRSMMTGIVLSGIGIGGLIAPPVSNWLISIYDWRVSFIILGSVSLVAVVLFAQFLRRDPAQVGQMPYGEIKVETGFEGDTKSFSLAEAVFTRQFWFMTTNFFCFGFCLYTILVHIVPHTTDLGFSSAHAANILATIGGAGIIGKVALGNVGDRIGNRYIFIIAFILMAAALLWLLRANEMWMLYLCIAIFGFAYGGIAASDSPIVAGLFGLRSHGVILGVIAIGFSIGSATGPFVSGYIFDSTGSYQTAFLASAIFATVGLILAIILRPTKKLGGRI